MTTAPSAWQLRGCALTTSSMLLMLGTASAFGQERASDRRRWLDSASIVSDDPRRVPVAPDSAGPAGTVVLVGGRVFDGTGAPARAGSVVIERNRISAIVGPETENWPAGARILAVRG